MKSAPAEPFVFTDVARVPAAGDNVAIALRILPAGARILIRQIVFEFSRTILEGHRFAIHRIRKGEPLLSWGLPFGLASRDIEPGEYVCNEKILRALSERTVDFELPKAANFIDHRLAYKLDAAHFNPGEQVKNDGPALGFKGFRRNERRGAGTRNYIVVLGTTSRSAGFVRAVAARFKQVKRLHPNIDGVVPVDHTEGASAARAHNFELTLHTLAGFMVNPNVAAVLCVDFGNEPLSNEALKNYLVEHHYPTDGLLHEFFSIGSSFEAALAMAEKKIESWLPIANGFVPEAVPLRYLKLGLQCGGSDAFSGVSANPLVGLLSRHTVGWGGSANLAETDELIGAESYVLENVRDLETAEAFLKTIDRFQEWASWHGHSAEGNPSGGNMYRGLYNITIKSIGAARKKDPATRLDYVIGFGDLMEHAGFYFMNSPGNDLESIAGQVASGCNMILFATGNGSITNFPFVPTIKLMTTTRRFELVRNEMDFNAGQYLDGESLEVLGREAFDQMLRVASGERSAGERAGHSQVQLWREWRQTGPSKVERTREANSFAEEGEKQLVPGIHEETVMKALAPAAPGRVALVLPTSLCSGQVANMIVNELNAEHRDAFSRAVALPHTEGCGNSAGESEQLFLRTMAGYLAHPLVAKAVLLEHGCEKTHNDAFRHTLKDLHIDASRYGFASIQLDGGIERVSRKVLKQFDEMEQHGRRTEAFSIGLVAQNPSAREMSVIRLLTSTVKKHGVSILAQETLQLGGKLLKYGERFTQPALHSMETPTEDLVEMISGLAGCGVQLILVCNSEWLVPGNPLVPTVQIATCERLPENLRSDVDLLLAGTETPTEALERIFQVIHAVRFEGKVTRNVALGNQAFQITRGYTGISL